MHGHIESTCGYTPGHVCSTSDRVRDIVIWQNGCHNCHVTYDSSLKFGLTFVETPIISELYTTLLMTSREVKIQW